MKKPSYFTQESQHIKALREHLNAVLGSLINHNFTNKETGLMATITQDEIDKISDYKAIKKSLDNGFTQDEHFKAAEHITELYEDANLKEKHKDRKGRINIQDVYRFNIEIEMNGENATAKITAFEKIEGRNRIYTIELMNLNPLPNSLRVQETEVAEPLNYGKAAHSADPTIASSVGGDFTTILPKSQASIKLQEKLENLSKIVAENQIKREIIPTDTFALSRGGTKLKQSSTDETIPQKSLNKTKTRRKQ